MPNRGATADRFDAVHWERYAQPDWNSRTSITEALCKLERAEDSAYDSILYAVGNNHAGTYFPVLLAVMPFLGEFICEGDDRQQRIALAVLDDLYGSFHPAPGHEQFETSDGEMRSLEPAFREWVASLAPFLEEVAGAGGPNALLAAELAEMIAEDSV